MIPTIGDIFRHATRERSAAWWYKAVNRSVNLLIAGILIYFVILII